VSCVEGLDLKAFNLVVKGSVVFLSFCLWAVSFFAF
jgi:hypothetical protein